MISCSVGGALLQSGCCKCQSIQQWGFGGGNFTFWASAAAFVKQSIRRVKRTVVVKSRQTCGAVNVFNLSDFVFFNVDRNFRVRKDLLGK